MKVLGYGALAIFTLILAACAGLGDFSSDDPNVAEAAPAFVGDFVVLSDADQSSATYATGNLERLPNGRDEIALFRDGIATGAAKASNSVVGWPEIAAASPDGRLVFTVETRGPPPGDVETVENIRAALAPGRRLNVYDVSGDAPALVDTTADIGQNPQSVAYVERGGFLVVATEAPDAELVVVRVDDAGELAGLRRLPLSLPLRDDDAEPFVRSLRPSPDGALLAANVANRRVQFYRLDYDADGLASAARPYGAATPDLGRRIAVGKWSADGRHFLISDTNGGCGSACMLTQGPGAMISLRPPAGPDAAPEIVSRATVGRFPESFDLSPDGTRIATVNMERTYLPNYWFLSNWPNRRRYSVTLLSFDADTGALAPLDEIRQAGALPEDIVFDTTGENLAVAVFHRRRGPARRRGFIDFFSLADDRNALSSQGKTQSLMRGAHALAPIY